MRTATVIVLFALLAISTAPAQIPSAPPTRVCPLGLYGCTAHPDILATWPARCPLCETVLKTVPSSASTVVGVAPAADRYSQQPGGAMREAQREQQWWQRQRQNEQWREWGQRNEQLRQQARRNAGRREQLRQNEGLGQPAPDLDYRPPEGYAYPYPYNYQYNPHTGQYEYVNPRYAFTPISIIDPGIIVGPGIDMDNRRRDEDERARAAQRQEQLEEQARRNAELWGWYPSYGYVPPGSYPYTYGPPGYAYPYPYDYYNGWNPGYAGSYGGYYYSPDTGQYYYSPRAGQYYYNPNTGQYEYRIPKPASPNPPNDERRERAEQPRR